MRTTPFFMLVALVAAGLPSLLVVSRIHAQEPSSLVSHRTEVGLGLRFMPIGWFDLADGAHRTGFRAYPALGFAPFVDYRLNRYFSVGVSPEVTLNVIPNRSDYVVGEMLLLNARLQVRYSDRRLEPYALLTGGYSVIRRDASDSAWGAVVGAALGLRAKFAHRHGVFAEVDYQKGFQTVNDRAYGPSYIIVSAGWQVAF